MHEDKLERARTAWIEACMLLWYYYSRTHTYPLGAAWARVTAVCNSNCYCSRLLLFIAYLVGAIGKRVEIYCTPYIPRTFMACAQVSADKGNHYFILDLFHFGELNATALNRFCTPGSSVEFSNRRWGSVCCEFRNHARSNFVAALIHNDRILCSQTTNKGHMGTCSLGT